MMNFLINGVEKARLIFDERKCKNLLNKIKKDRNFKKLFISHSDWKFGKYKHIKNNPGPGRNLLNKLDTQFIFDNNKFINLMRKVVGKNYRILDSKLVMGVPKYLIPKWILDMKKDSHTVNLGEFIKPKYRDITYFRGIDFHQDIIDFPTRGPDFITAYLYLENVDKNSAPLYVIPDTHIPGATKYPHKITRLNDKRITYVSNNLKKKKYTFKVLTGKQGTLHYWHPFILHGTQPHKKDIGRISVRMLVEKNRQIDINCNLDKLNKKIKGNMKLKIYNFESNKKSKKNIINRLS